MLPVRNAMGRLFRRAGWLLSAAALGSTAAWAGDARPADGSETVADAAPVPAAIDAGRMNRLTGATSLPQILERIGRGPDRSEQGGACGGIVLHDWRDENLRVITLGDRVQAISRLAGESGSDGR